MSNPNEMNLINVTVTCELLCNYDGDIFTEHQLMTSQIFTNERSMRIWIMDYMEQCNAVLWKSSKDYQFWCSDEPTPYFQDKDRQYTIDIKRNVKLDPKVLSIAESLKYER